MDDLFWELFQQKRVSDANNAALDAKFAARTAETLTHRFESQIRTLEQQTERLVLAMSAMAEILRDTFHVSQETIEAKMREIDLRDGHLDGKVTREAKLCGACHRPNGQRRTHCLYCGEALPIESFLFPQP